MAYFINETFYTLQGEGANSGRAAVFCRFAGCNLWSGIEKDRPKAICKFCDTDFRGVNGSGGGRFDSAIELARHARAIWSGRTGRPLIVCTGGEPLLQLDVPLVDALHGEGFEVAIETNGTIAVPSGVDWICVSPKIGAPLIVKQGHELKFVYPQEDVEPTQLESLKFSYFFLQPMDGPCLESNTQLAIEFCLKNPQWRLSLQTHKILGIR